ncbi:MAG: hypothetical protein H6572_03815 [Lewinellaceae bacterium]|nr:hypothetical protein [Lewinellaceae bacterium]
MGMIDYDPLGNITMLQRKGLIKVVPPATQNENPKLIFTHLCHPIFKFLIKFTGSINKILMKINFLALLFITSLRLFSQNSINSSVAKYQVSVTIDDTGFITGKCDIKLNSLQYTGDTIWLHLCQNAFADKNSFFFQSWNEIENADFYFESNEFLAGYQELTVTSGGRKLTISNIKDEFIPILKTEINDQNIKIEYKTKFFNHPTTRPYVDAKLIRNWFPRVASIIDGKFIKRPFSAYRAPIINTYDLDADISISMPDTLLAYKAFPVVNQDGSAKYHLKFHGAGEIPLLLVGAKLPCKRKNGLELCAEERYFNYKTNIKSFENDVHLQCLKDCTESIFGDYSLDKMIVIGNGSNHYLLGVPGIGVLPERNDYAKVKYRLFDVLYAYSLMSSKRYFDVLEDDEQWLYYGLANYFAYEKYEHKNENLKISYGNKPSYYDYSWLNELHYWDKDLDLYDQDLPKNHPEYMFQSRLKGTQYIKWIEYTVGVKTLIKSITSLIDNGEKIDPSSLRNKLEELSGKSMAWLFDDVIKQGKLPKFNLEIVSDNGSEVNCKVSSNVDFPVPAKLKLMGATFHDTILLAPFVHDTMISIPRTLEHEYLYLDPDNLGQSIDNSERLVKISNFGDFKATNYTTSREGFFEKKSRWPFAILGGLNYNDGFELGLAYSNRSWDKKLNFGGVALWGFRSKSVVGEFRISDFIDLHSKKIEFFEPALNIRSYHYYTPSPGGVEFDPLRYIRINPQLILHFRHEPLSRKYSRLKLEYIDVTEEKIDFSPMGEILGTNFESRHIMRLGYNENYYNTFGNWVLDTYLEYQKYDEKNYLKLSAAMEKTFAIGVEKFLTLRLWGGYFIMNDQRNSSNHSDEITRGSFAMAFQGFNDYAYDNYFHTRQNQSSHLIQQVALVDGGFKTPVGRYTKNFMSNDMAMSLNTEVDFPIRMPRFFKLKIFGDVGFYRTKDFQNEPLRFESLFSLGLAWRPFDGVGIYLPLINSKAINDEYDQLGHSLLGRFSFSIDLNRLDFMRKSYEKPYESF